MSFLILLSPAKSLRFDDAPLGSENSLPLSSPRFEPRTQALADALAGLPAESLMAWMGVSRPLAELNAERFSRLALPPASRGPGPAPRRALFAFNGDAYEGISPESLPPEALAFLNQRLLLLSGLYGALRPADAMLPYRLEMGRKPPGVGAKSLLAFWGDSIAKRIIEDARALGAQTILNLASEEYAQSALPGIRSLAPEIAIAHARFESHTPSGWKVISFDAKRARGLLTRCLALSRPSEALDAAKAFNAEGWGFEGESIAKGSSELLFRKRNG